MSIQISAEAEARIRELLEQGEYDDPGAVIDEALRVLEERNREQYAQLKAAIAVGMEQYERGEMIPWTPDMLDRLKREADELVRRGTVSKDTAVKMPPTEQV